MAKSEQAATVKEKSTAGKTQAAKSAGERFNWPFTRKNLIWFLAAIAVILVGYVFLGIGPYDSVSSLTIGPILLVIGYVVLLPISIIVRDKPKQS